ncbi:hypothetical protein CMI47_04525 [Candidatus Pacearchaeota archaeon]|jgi:hypothetical protein|nr:hypothetical protein [Candidatus Pacearchaeota archaeon]|tara:strand:+ start:3197 stop:3619 length:423 start_codon:yes stop_codon:yes gene_type:complete
MALGIGNLLGSLVAPVADIFKAREARKLQKAEAEATVDRILTEASAQDAAVAGQIALHRVQNEQTSWKDEYALIVISGPFVVGMVSGALEGAGVLPAGTTNAIMSGMFGNLDNVPEWWSNTFQAGMLSALGITLWNKAKK